MPKIESDLGYTRDFLIVLGLLLGCDYDPKGIPGVGRENATKFLNELVNLSSPSPVDILARVRSWSSHDFYSQGLKYEDRIRKLVQVAPTFPNEEIIDEYKTVSKLAQTLMSQEKYLTIKWSRPNLKACQVTTK